MPQTWQEMAKMLSSQNPNIQFYVNDKRDAIGYFNHTLGRVQVLIAITILGRWAQLADIEVNGEPLFPAGSWETISEVRL